MDVVDNQIPGAFDQVMHSFFYLIETVTMIVYATPWFLVPALPMAILYYLILVSIHFIHYESASPYTLNVVKQQTDSCPEI